MRRTSWSAAGPVADAWTADPDLQPPNNTRSHRQRFLGGEKVPLCAETMEPGHSTRIWEASQMRRNWSAVGAGVTWLKRRCSSVALNMQGQDMAGRRMTPDMFFP